MTSDLLISLPGHGSLFEIHSLQDGIFAEFLLKIQNRMLDPFLLLKLRLFLFLFLLKCFIIGKEIHLLKDFLFLRFSLRNHSRSHNIDSAYQQIRIDNPVIQILYRLHNHSGRRGIFRQVRCSMRMLRHLSSITVSCDLSMELIPDSRIGQIVNIIADGKHHLVGDKSLIHQIKHQQICHFLHNARSPRCSSPAYMP